MRIGQRLFLAVLPAIVGLLTVAALAYFGEYARRAPEWLVITAVVASIGSAVLAWRNTRYVAQRVEQLAARRDGDSARARGSHGAADLIGSAWRPLARRGGDTDELDRIESVVQQLTGELAAARKEVASERERLSSERREYVSLVEHAVKGAIQQLEEVRLPLHILLENHFGDLNENQEEILGAARSASEAVDARLLYLREVARVDLGAAPLRREPVQVAELIRAALAPLHLAATGREVTITVDLAPALPTIDADRRRLRDAIATLLSTVFEAVPPAGTLRVVADVDGHELRVMLSGAKVALPHPGLALATRVIHAHGGKIEVSDGTLHVHLPRAAAGTDGIALHDLQTPRGASRGESGCGGTPVG